MTAHTAIRRPFVGLSWMEQHEVKLGRTAWTRADYVAAGGAEFDRQFTASRAPHPGERDHFIRAWVDLNCPVAKRSQGMGG